MDASSLAADVDTAPAAPPAALAAHAPAHEVVIEPRKGWIGVDWAEMVRYRELLAFLVWRDVKVKYKQAVLGVAWAVFIPLISMLIYGAVGKLADFEKFLTFAPPYFVWMFAGLVPWLFLQRAISDGGMALVSQQALMTKIYLPRLFLPAASCGNAFVDMAVNFGLLGALLAFYAATVGWLPSWQLAVALPPLLVLTWTCALGVAFLLSAATVLYRDLRFLIPFVVQFGLWLSAVPYPLGLVGEKSLAWYALALNPFTGIVAGFRSAVTGEPWPWLHLATSAGLSAALLVFGLFYFKRVERRFADIA